MVFGESQGAESCENGGGILPFGSSHHVHGFFRNLGLDPCLSEDDRGAAGVY